MPKLSAAALKAKIAALQQQLVAAQKNKTPAIRKVCALMKKLGVTVEDLVEGSKVKTPKVGKKGGRTANKELTNTETGVKIPIKYQDGQGNRWTGRGKTPKWLAEAEKSGKSREEFRI